MPAQWCRGSERPYNSNLLFKMPSEVTYTSHLKCLCNAWGFLGVLTITILCFQNEPVETLDALHVLNKPKIFRMCRTFTVCEDQLLSTCSGVCDMGEKTAVPVRSLSCIRIDGSQVPVLYGKVYSYSENICDVCQLCYSGLTASARGPETQTNIGSSWKCPEIS